MNMYSPDIMNWIEPIKKQIDSIGISIKMPSLVILKLVNCTLLNKNFGTEIEELI